MKKNLLKLLSLLFVVFALTLSSCDEEETTSKPTIDFTFELSGHEATFTSTVTDVTTYAWSFGDANVSTEANPVHTYAAGGDYEVTCVVEGEGGTATATKTVSVDYTDEELLSGTWVLDAVTEGALTDLINANVDELPAGFLAIYSLPGAYADKFTFSTDGTMSLDNTDGQSFGGILTAMTVLQLADEAALMAAVMAGDVTLPKDPSSGELTGDLGVCDFNYAIPASATWTLATGDVVINEGTAYEVTFPGEKYITFSTGAYFGVCNLFATVIVKSLSADELTVTMFLNGEPALASAVSHTIELTYVHPE